MASNFFIEAILQVNFSSDSRFCILCFGIDQNIQSKSYINMSHAIPVRSHHSPEVLEDVVWQGEEVSCWHHQVIHVLKGRPKHAKECGLYFLWLAGRKAKNLSDFNLAFSTEKNPPD